MSSKIAILIDAENISSKYLMPILEEIPHHGEVILRAVYGNWENPQLQRWQQIAEENDFHIRHQPNPFKTKNSSDYKLMLDAMDVLHWIPVEVFCLVTNDADYVPLCHTIHESGKSVIGVGYQNASEALIRACDKFIFIGREEFAAQPPVPPLTKASNGSTKKPAAPASADPLVIQKLLSDAFAGVSKDANGWVALTSLGSILPPVKTFGYPKLTKLLLSMPDFVELNAETGAKSARLKNNTPPLRPDLSDLQELLSDAFAKVPRDAHGWATLSSLGLVLPPARTFGHPKLAKLLLSMPDVVELNAKTGAKSARLRN